MLQEHLGYVSDAARLKHYTEAIRRVIKPGDCVLDLGCGSGVLGLLCLRAGAARIIAVDATVMIDVARETMARAELSSRAVFIRGESRRVDLSERVDAIICDQTGYFGFDAGILRDLGDARRRFLKDAGALIPSSLSLHVAGVESGPAYAPVSGWASETVPAELHWLKERALNTRYPVSLSPGALLTVPVLLGSIDLFQNGDGLHSWTVDLRATRDGTLNGIGGWFDCQLAPGVYMTNSPLADGRINRPQAFFPIRRAAELRAGDRVTVTIIARPNENLIAWVVGLPCGERLRQSTWNGMLLSPDDLHRSNPSRMPRPNRMAHARATILRYCDDRLTAREVEESVLRDHPDLFPSPAEISRVVAQVLAKDTD